MIDDLAFKELDDVYEGFTLAVKTHDVPNLNLCLQNLERYEELFLNSYAKRKTEGVYYTSKEIADFIVKKTLFMSLKKKLMAFNIHLDSFEHLEDLRNTNSKEFELINAFLLSMKICDPTCGSGVFLLSHATIRFKVIKNLNPGLDDVSIKLKIIETLKGYDINDQAIKLCILKLFKWAHLEASSEHDNIFSLLSSNITIKNTLLNPIETDHDLIIGNPPYGNILSKEEKTVMKQKNIYYKDIYCAFILRSLEFCEGILGLLVPKSFLLRQGYIKFRNALLSKANILKIYDIGSNLFKRATNEVQVLIFVKKKGFLLPLRVYDYPDKHLITYENQTVDTLKTCLNENCPFISKAKKFFIHTFQERCPHCGSKTIDLNRIRVKMTEQIFHLIEKIEKTGDLNYLNVKDFPMLIRGEEDEGLRKVKKHLKDHIDSSCYFISAKKDVRYYFFSKRKSFNIEDINHEHLKGNNYEYYLGPKLLIKHNNIIPEAVYTEDNVCFTSSIYSLLHEDDGELSWICALLNSALIQFYCIYGINNQKDTTINLNQYMIRHLPLIHPESESKKDIINCVEKISKTLNSNKGLINDDVKHDLISINDKVFSLYSITNEEKELIISNLIEQVGFFKEIYT